MLFVGGEVAGGVVRGGVELAGFVVLLPPVGDAVDVDLSLFFPPQPAMANVTTINASTIANDFTVRPLVRSHGELVD